MAKRNKKTTPPPGKISFGTGNGQQSGLPPAVSFGTSPLATPTTPYPNPGYTPGFGYGLPGRPLTSFGTPPPYGPYRFPAGYVQPTIPATQGGGGGAPTGRGGTTWSGVDTNMTWMGQPRSAWDLMLNNAYGYGLTYDQTKAGYVPGESERNAYGQPLGTAGPLNNRRMGLQGTQQGPTLARENNKLLGWNPGTFGVEKPSNWTQVLTGRTRGKDRRKAIKKAQGGGKDKAGDGVTPGWVGGMARFNLP